MNATDPNMLLVGGGCLSVGVAGFYLGGGLSFLSRQLGVGADSVLAVRAVLANGTIVDVSDSSQPHLFRAMLSGKCFNLFFKIYFYSTHLRAMYRLKAVAAISPLQPILRCVFIDVHRP